MRSTVEKKIDELAMAVQQGFLGLEEKMDGKFGEVGKRFEEVDRRFDRIENILISGHERRIENLEDRVLVISSKIGLKRK